MREANGIAAQQRRQRKSLGISGFGNAYCNASSSPAFQVHCRPASTLPLFSFAIQYYIAVYNYRVHSSRAFKCVRRENLLTSFDFSGYSHKHSTFRFHRVDSLPSSIGDGSLALRAAEFSWTVFIFAKTMTVYRNVRIPCVFCDWNILQTFLTIVEFINTQ